MKWGSTAPTHAGWYRARAPKQIQPVTVEESRGMADSAWSIFSRIATGLGLYAAVGWLFSLWLGHAPELIATGALIGLGLAFYMVLKDLSTTSPNDARRRSK